MRPDFECDLAQQPVVNGWQAQLQLALARRDGKTRLVKRQHHGPLTVQRAFYPEGEVCHLYLLHPPGGIVASDALQIEVEVAEQGHALLTTPAAGKFYRSHGPLARQNVRLKVAADSALEWLPQETIVYDGARLHTSMSVELEPGARWCAWEITVLGRPAADEGFSYGDAQLNWLIRLDGKTLYRERMRLDAEAANAPWGMRGHNSAGTFFAYPCDAAQLAAVQELVGEHPLRGVTLIDRLLICRALDNRADHLRGWFEQIWTLLRPDLMNTVACAPRIWAT